MVERLILAACGLGLLWVATQAVLFGWHSGETVVLGCGIVLAACAGYLMRQSWRPA